MKMLSIVLLLGVFAVTALASNISGRGVNQGGTRALTEWLSLTLISKKDGKLYPQLAWTRGEGLSETTTLGHGVAPGAEFVYLWDGQAQMFWFADRESVVKVEMAAAREGQTSVTSMSFASCLRSESIPEEVRSLLTTLAP